MSRPDPTDLAHAAGLIHAVLGTLRELAAGRPVDPAHAERIESIEEAARLVADAATESPRSLRVAPLAGFRGLVLRLAMEMDDPCGAGESFAGDPVLSELEAAHGSHSAALMGLAMALDAAEVAIGRNGASLPHGAAVASMVWVPRESVRTWTRQVVAAVSLLEGEVLRRDGDPALRRDAWALACLVSIALAHVTDHACVDARVALARVAEAGAALSQAVALRTSQTAAGGGAYGEAELACMRLVDVVDEGMRLLREGIAGRESRVPTLTWRLITRGRTGFAASQIESIVRGACEAVPAGEDAARIGRSLARAALSYEEEWRAA